jgi:hypothetical protein
MKTNVGQSPPATNILIKGKNQNLQRAPNQQLGLGEVYKQRLLKKREEAKNWKNAILYGLKPIQDAQMQRAFDSDQVPQNFLLEGQLPSR